MYSTTHHKKGRTLTHILFTGLALTLLTGYFSAFPVPQMPDGRLLGVALIQDKIYGQLTETQTGTPVDGILVNITANQTGFLWSNTTGENDLAIHGIYNTGNTLSPIAGELVTVVVSDEASSGFRGSASGLAEEDQITRIDLTVQDIAAPNVSVHANTAQISAGDNINLSATIADNLGINSVRLSLTYPNQSQSAFNLSDPENDTIYHQLFNDTQLNGTYLVSFTANDTTGLSKNQNISFTVIINMTSWSESISVGWSLISIPLNI